MLFCHAMEAVPVAKSKMKRKRALKSVLKLPDLEQSKSAVLKSLTSPSSQRTYDHAISIMQIAHNGRNSHSSLRPDGSVPVAPSAIPGNISAFTRDFRQVKAESPRTFGG